MGELDGKVAIITGAGRMRGIGRGSAVALARQGADIVVTGTGRSPSTFPDDEKAAGWRDVESTAEQVRALGRRCLPLLCDVTQMDQVQSVVDRTLEEFGRIDVLVNNAAFRRGEDRVPIVDMDPDVFRAVVDIKLFGSFLFSKAVGKVLMRQNQGGSVVFMSSIGGRRAMGSTAAYAAANFGLHALTQSLAHELAPYKVTVNAVCPGPVDTSRMDSAHRDPAWQETLNRVPLRRIASDEDIGEVVAWLCTPAASLITGQHINVNGGMLMD
jgi:NAD(P)-dependent dehydrogenase (short-subunit alcohol dehydrogenase family)